MTTLRIFTFFSLLTFLINISALGQKQIPLNETNFIGSYSITISFHKTTHLIFPFNIIYVDLGSGNILAEKVGKVENILKVKAGSANFPQTNLTVLTSEGKYFSFLVSYVENPQQLSYIFNDELFSKKSISAEATHLEKHSPLNTSDANFSIANFENVRFSEAQLEMDARTILQNRKSGKQISSLNGGTMLTLHSLHVKENIFYLPVDITNSSNINYDIDFIRLYIRDRKIVKRTSYQEQEIQPLYVYNTAQQTINGKSAIQKVFVLEKFTIPDDKVLVIEMFEKKGGRQMFCKIKSKYINNATLFY